METTHINAIGALQSEKRRLEKYLATELNPMILNDINNEIAEMDSAIRVLRKH